MVSSLSYPVPALRDDVVEVRPWASRDLPCVEEASTDRIIPTGTSVPTVYSEREGLAFIERQHSRLTNGQGVAQTIAEADSGRAVGQIVVLLRGTPAGEAVAGLGYWVVQSARGQGYATHAVRLVVPWVLGDLGIRRLEALVDPGNIRSRKVLESNGFSLEGTLRSYFDRDKDAVMYSIVDSDRANS